MSLSRLGRGNPDLVHHFAGIAMGTSGRSWVGVELPGEGGAGGADPIEEAIILEGLRDAATDRKFNLRKKGKAKGYCTTSLRCLKKIQRK